MTDLSFLLETTSDAAQSLGAIKEDAGRRGILMNGVFFLGGLFSSSFSSPEELCVALWYLRI